MELFDYQNQAINFILNNKNCALFLSMGTGKTVITLTALNQLRGKSLVIAPKAVAENVWAQELGKWRHLNLTASVITGNQRQRSERINNLADLYIISRDNIGWLLKNHLKFFQSFNNVVYDELSSFKNSKAQRTRALIKHYNPNARHIGLTGTPSPNGYGDLWAQYRILDGGQILGASVTGYYAKYFYPLIQRGYVVYKWGITPENKTIINELIKPITMTAENNNLNLPTPDFKLVNFTLEEEAECYKTFRRNKCIKIDKTEIMTSGAADTSNKLLQIANGQIYGRNKQPCFIGSSRANALKKLLKELNGAPALIAYWYDFSANDIIKVAEELNLSYGIVKDNIKAWNNGEIQVGLIHPASAGHGLNLQFGGHNLIWYMLPWSLEFYEQTNGRLVRPGQKAKNVNIYILNAVNTLDIVIYNTLQAKNDVQEALINAVKNEE